MAVDDPAQSNTRVFRGDRYEHKKTVFENQTLLQSDIPSGESRCRSCQKRSAWPLISMGGRPQRSPMKALKKGGFSVTVDLEKGREYQYRYVVGDGTWITDEAADKHVHCAFADCWNSVVVV